MCVGHEWHDRLYRIFFHDVGNLSLFGHHFYIYLYTYMFVCFSSNYRIVCCYCVAKEMIIISAALKQLNISLYSLSEYCRYCFNNQAFSLQAIKKYYHLQYIQIYQFI